MSRTFPARFELAVLSLFFAALLFPAAARAGSAAYTSPGTYTFTVPSYNTLSVTVNGAGGGGEGGFYGFPSGEALFPGNGGNGGDSWFNGTVYSGGGEGGYLDDGGCNYAQAPSPGGCGDAPANGADGSASGGNISNTPGGGAGGGGGGSGYYTSGGASGGNGGQASITYGVGALTPNSGITVVVGGGGGGGGGAYDPYTGDGSSGGNGSVYISWTSPPAATCSVSADTNPLTAPNSTILRWTSSNADQSLYINSIGYVGASGSTTVAPSSSTDYSCYAEGSGGSDGWHSFALAVKRQCTFNGLSIQNGSSVTAYQSSTVPYGSVCSSVSQSRTCTDGSLSGSYTYSSCTVNPPASCTLNGQTISSGSSITAYSAQSAPQGQLCSSYSQTRSCTNGTLSGSATYQYASCSCAPSYSCSGQTVQHTDSSCSVSNVTSCVSPGYCSAGSAVCLYPAPQFNTSGQYSGHLQINPSVVPEGNTTTVHWNMSYVSSCSVTGTNGDSWTGASGSETSKKIQSQTIYTLACTGDDNSSINESQTVYVIPTFDER